jgi:thioredoxin 1
MGSIVLKGSNMSVIELTSENFASTVLQSRLPFIVDFWAEWCAPCKLISPIVETIADEQVDRLAFGKLNVDEQADIAASFGIRSIPTLLVFVAGEPVDAIIGAMPKEELMYRLTPFLRMADQADN